MINIFFEGSSDTGIDNPILEVLVLILINTFLFGNTGIGIANTFLEILKILVLTNTC